MLDCRDCNPKYNAKECGGKEYYIPRDIRFCTYQCMWLIYFLPILGEGLWPLPGEDLNYIDTERRGEEAVGRKAKTTSAYFEIPLLLKVDIELRLKKTGADGEVLEAQIEAGRPFYKLSSRAGDALFYICGSRKSDKFKIPYSRWKADVNAGMRKQI